MPGMTCSLDDIRPPESIIRFSCSNQLSTKFQLLIKTKVPTNELFPCFKFCLSKPVDNQTSNDLMGWPILTCISN